MRMFLAVVVSLGLVPAASRAQESQPSDSAARVVELRRMLEGIRAAVEGLRGQAGALPDPGPAGATSKRPVLGEGLPPEKAIDLLASAVEDLRASVKNLQMDLAFRKVGDRIAQDIAARKPSFERLAPPPGSQPPVSTAPTPSPPPAPVPPPTAPPGGVSVAPRVGERPQEGKPVEPAVPPISGEPAPASPPVMIPFERKVPDLPVEATSGADRVVLRVSGVEIRKSEVDDLVGYLKSYRSGPDGVLVRDALERALIPLAAMRARYKDRLSEMQARAESLRGEVAGGKDFAEVARANSDDRVTGPNGGDLGIFSREEMKLSFARGAFTAKKGEIPVPVWSPFGLHLLRVDDVMAGEKPAQDRVRARHILVGYDPKDSNFYQTLNKLIDEANVEVVDPAFRNAVPPRFLRGK